MAKRPWLLLTYAAIGLFGFVAMRDVFLYYGRSPSKAAAVAQEIFEQECTKRNLDVHKYSGPDLLDQSDRAYKFVWRGPSQIQDIHIIVHYLPRYTEVSF